CCSFVAGLVTAHDEQLGRGGQALPACLPQLSSLKTGKYSFIIDHLLFTIDVSSRAAQMKRGAG
ncbi:MAG: hypothetical protein M3407_08355, partial [Acidobacteriota bacterium]|nr:hypothetical protein [Acidobacteriota bacterium]